MNFWDRIGSSSPWPRGGLGSDLVRDGRGDGGVALLGDGQGQENAGGDGHMTHDIADREQHPDHDKSDMI